MATTQVILKERIHNLGAEGDVVKVRAGFARNFLLPRGKAFEATKSNVTHLENLKKARAEREGKEMEEFEKVAVKLRRLKLRLTLATGQGGKAFGSITALDIQKAIEDEVKFKLEKHQVELEKPIKSAGKFEIPVKLHPQIEAIVNLSVFAAGAPEKRDEEDSGEAKGE
jgi:large subunit ribosomal protein L9